MARSKVRSDMVTKWSMFVTAFEQNFLGFSIRGHDFYLAVGCSLLDLYKLIGQIIFEFCSAIMEGQTLTISSLVWSLKFRDS
jgi:hypothetical protein